MDLVGHYKCEKNENLNKFYKAVGLGFFSRLFVRWGKPTVAVLKLEDLWSITIRTKFTTRERIFRLGQEFTEFLPGRYMKSEPRMDNGKLIIKTCTDGKINTITHYEFTPTTLLVRIIEEKSGVETRRYFKKLNTKL